MRRLLICLALTACAARATPAACYAVASGTWNTASIWASTSGGAGGSCTAAGGAGLPIMGTTTTLAVGVPGATGLFDRAIINTGITVHIPVGVGIDLGELNYGASGLTEDSLTINATSSTVYGALIVDDGGLIRLHGGSSANDNLAIVAQYAVLQVAPGGSLWLGAFSNGPEVAVSGRMYVGCGDQSAYPSPECSGNDGAWVTAAVASTLNFTAASGLPYGLAAGNLVELSPIPQPLSFAYPYAIDGVTPPPAPPIMPQTTDTGTSPMRTCGSAGTCMVPNDALLCVVAVSGSSASLGWPQGGTPAAPYCTGAETAMAVSNAGSGKLWLKKPAFFWGDPTGYTWSNAATFAPSGATSQMDATRSGIWSLGANNYPGPISNAAGTGPGRLGDTSVSVTSSNWGAPCAFLSIQAVTSSGCFQDFSDGSIVAYGHLLSFTGSISYKQPSPLANVGAGGVVIPAGARSYNELVFANADLRYVYDTSATPVIQFSTLPNTSNNHLAFVYSTAFMSRGEVGVSGVSLTSATPLQIDNNSFLSAEVPLSEYGDVHVLFTASSSYVDLSNNYMDDFTGLFRCNLSSSTGSATETFDHVTAVNNQVVGTYFDGTDNYNTCNWTHVFAADNRVTANGDGNGVGPGYAGAFQTLNSTTANASNLFQDNYVYGDHRGFFSSSWQRWTQNYFAYPWHHVGTVTSWDSTVGQVGGYIPGLAVDHNLMVAASNQSLPCFNSGYDQFEFIDGLTFSNNTCLISGAVGNGGGGFEIGDSDSQSSSAIAGLKVTDNIVGLPVGLLKTLQGSPNFEQNQITDAGWNSAQSTNAMYSGFATNPDNVPNPEVFGTAYASLGGVNYNTSTTRNITGVAIQNPTYAAAVTGCLKYTYTSQSSITMAWSVDPSCATGTGFGTPVQLNWGGAGTTYSIASSAAGPGGVGATSMVLTASGTPFIGMPTTTATGVYVPTGCPLARWAWATTGADAGHAYAVTSCPGTYNTATATVAVVPNDAATIGTPTVAVMNWEIRLVDGGGTNSIDIGIDPRSLPNPGTTTTLTDNGIALTPEDYCGSAQGCARLPVVAGMSPIFPVPMPILGGSAEEALCNGQAACGGTSYYAPSGTAWTTASSAGSYIGAVPFFGTPAIMVPRHHGGTICCDLGQPLVGGGSGGALVVAAPRTQPAFQGSAYRDGDLTDGGAATGGAVVAIAGGAAPYTCTLASGSLPAGMSLAEVAPASYPPGLCEVSGTPSAAGSYPMTVKVQDAASNSASQAVMFTVLSSSLPVFTNVLATSVSPTQEAITWTTSMAASSKVCSSIGNDVATCTPETDATGATAHSVTLSNLWPSQSYQYFVESRGVAGGVPQDSLAATDGLGCCTDTFVAAAALTTGTSTMFAVPVGPHNVAPGSPLYVGVYYGPTLGKTSSANAQFIVTGLPPFTKVHWPDRQDNGSMQGTVSTTSTTDDTITFSGLGSSGTTMFEILTNVGGSTPAGNYTLNVSGNVIVGGSTVSTANSTWAMGVEPQAFPGSLATAFPAIPDLALWQTNMTYPWPSGSGTPGYWYNQQQNGGACEWDNDDQGVIYYDGAWVYDQIGAYTNNTAFWITGSNAAPCPSAGSPQGAAGALAMYHQKLVADSYSPPGYWVFPHGLYYACVTGGNAQACTDLHSMASGGNGVLVSNNTGYFDAVNVREGSYALGLRRLDYDAGGGSSTLAQVQQLVNHALGYVDNIVEGTTGAEQPFMDGLLAQALLEYYLDPKTGNQADARIPPALKALADHLWAVDWIPRAGGNGFFIYNLLQENNGILTTGGGSDLRNLNLLVAPLYAWLYEQTGNPVYQKEGDAIWDSGVTDDVNNGIGWSGKNFSQQYRWSFDYALWRSH